jgi:hypothetical protein
MRLSQFVTFAVVTNQCNRHDASDAESRQVVDDGAGGAGIRSNAHHLIGIEARLQRRLGQRSVDIQVSVEKQVAEHADCE